MCDFHSSFSVLVCFFIYQRQIQIVICLRKDFFYLVRKCNLSCLFRFKLKCFYFSCTYNLFIMYNFPDKYYMLHRAELITAFDLQFSALGILQCEFNRSDNLLIRFQPGRWHSVRS